MLILPEPSCRELILPGLILRIRFRPTYLNLKGRRGHKDLKEKQGQRETRGIKGIPVTPARRGIRGILETRDRLELTEKMELPDPQVYRVMSIDPQPALLLLLM